MSDHKHWAGQNGAGGGSFLCSYYTKLKINFLYKFKQTNKTLIYELTPVLLIADAAAKETQHNTTKPK